MLATQYAFECIPVQTSLRGAMVRPSVSQGCFNSKQPVLTEIVERRKRTATSTKSSVDFEICGCYASECNVVFREMHNDEEHTVVNTNEQWYTSFGSKKKGANIYLNSSYAQMEFKL